jgi:two-component system response regulator FixJ
MPGMSGLELLRELNVRGIEIPVIVLTGYADVPTAVRALKGGAVEFLEKPFNDDVLLEQIRMALALDARRRNERGTLEVVRERTARLTPRESEILALVVEGLSSKEIASRLNTNARRAVQEWPIRARPGRFPRGRETFRRPGESSIAPLR